MADKSNIELKQQSRKFTDAAKAAKCDESEATFDGKLKRIAKAKPMPKTKKEVKK